MSKTMWPENDPANEALADVHALQTRFAKMELEFVRLARRVEALENVKPQETERKLP